MATKWGSIQERPQRKLEKRIAKAERVAKHFATVNTVVPVKTIAPDFGISTHLHIDITTLARVDELARDAYVRDMYQTILNSF